MSWNKSRQCSLLQHLHFSPLFFNVNYKLKIIPLPLSDFIKTKTVRKYHWQEFVIPILRLIDSLVVSFKGKSKDQVRVHQRTEIETD